MSLLNHLIGVIAPHDCINCNSEGALLCRICVQQLPAIPSRCFRCRKLTDNYQTCPACRKTSKLFAVRAGTVYAKAAKKLIWRLKYSGAQSAASEIATFLSENLSYPNHCVFVPVPTATKRVRRRGYDQAKLIARQLSRQTGLAYVDCLSRSGQTRQIGALRQQRLKQLGDAFRIKNMSLGSGLCVVLVDDVVTTGATLESAAQCLKAAGVKKVEAVVFAQA